jgi:hypothetical protein
MEEFAFLLGPANSRKRWRRNFRSMQTFVLLSICVKEDGRLLYRRCWVLGPGIIGVEELGRSHSVPTSVKGCVIINIGYRRPWCRRCIIVVSSHYAPWSVCVLGTIEPINSKPAIAMALLFPRKINIRSWACTARCTGGRPTWCRIRAAHSYAGLPGGGAGCDIVVEECFDGCVFLWGNSVGSRSGSHIASDGTSGLRAVGRGDRSSETWSDGCLCGAGCCQRRLQRPSIV